MNKKPDFEFPVDIDLSLLKKADRNQTLERLNDTVGKPTKNIQAMFKRFFSNPYSTVAFAVFVLILLAAFLFPAISPFSPNQRVAGGRTSFNWAPPVWINGGVIERILPGSIESDATLGVLESLVGDNIFKSIEDAKNAIKIIDDGSGEIVYFIKYNPLNSLSVSQNPILGLDGSGRDIWTRIWTGTRQSIILAFAVTITEFAIGTVIGAYIGFHAGTKVDTFLMRIIEIIRSVPQLIWFVILIFVLPKGDFFPLYFALILVGWVPPVYTTRLYIIRVKDSEFIQSAKSIGVSMNGQIFIHALPNIVGKLLVGFVHRIPRVIFAEASLAFLGLVSNPDAATLGNIIDNAKNNFDKWWYLVTPATILLFLTISLQIVANGLHDAFDPRIGR